MEGLWSVFGESELTFYGVSREQMVLSLCVGCVAALLLGTFLGMFSDLIGQRKICLVFCILHLLTGIWKKYTAHSSLWVASISLSLATSIFLFSFETWMVVEHEKQGHRQDTLNDIFWLMTFFESACLIGSQVVANWLIGGNVKRNISTPSTASILLAMLGIICISRGWSEAPKATGFKDYRMSLYNYIFGDKRIWLLACAQACLAFSIAVFWILWAPTLVADGREVHLGLIYPLILGARMLGSTTFPWLVTGPLAIRTEDCLVYVFIFMGLILSIIAYDYQEIGFLVMLFCLFHGCVGLVLPSLARLRTMYVPNELRGGMISLSLAPTNGAFLFFLMQGGYYHNIGNAAIMGFAALGLFTASICMYMLKRLGKQPYQGSHKL